MSNESGYIQMVQECEIAIVMIRALVVAGRGNSEEAGALFEQIRIVSTPRLMGYIRRTGWLSPMLAEEALERMYERLFRDVWSLRFVSLEHQFGAYLKAMPVRVLVTMRTRSMPNGTLPASMHRPVVEDGMTLSEVLSVVGAEAFDEVLGLRELILRLPVNEREVLLSRAVGVPNQDIARQRGVSNASITRIYQRATTTLRRWLEHPEEAPPLYESFLGMTKCFRESKAA